MFDCKGSGWMLTDGFFFARLLADTGASERDVWCYLYADGG